jgi:hypothetical protein
MARIGESTGPIPRAKPLGRAARPANHGGIIALPGSVPQKRIADRQHFWFESAGHMVVTLRGLALVVGVPAGSSFHLKVSQPGIACNRGALQNPQPSLSPSAAQVLGLVFSVEAAG